MKFFLKYTFLLTFSPFFLLSFEMPTSCNLHGSLDLIAGYRTDQSSISMRAYDFDETFLFREDLKIKNITIGEIGIEGRLEAWQGVFTRGYANYGWVGDGNFSAITSEVSDEIIPLKAKTHKGHVKDFSIGLGYLFRFQHYFTIGPIAGWSYDSQELTISHVGSEGLLDPIFNGLNYKTCWKGAWLGLEGQLEIGYVKIRGGYDFHIANWKSDFRFNDSVIDEINLKSHRGYGNVAFLDGFYTFCGGWELGLGVKYQYWTSRKGRAASSFPVLEIPVDGIIKIHSVHWKSCEGRLTLGYSF